MKNSPISTTNIPPIIKKFDHSRFVFQPNNEKPTPKKMNIIPKSRYFILIRFSL